MNSLQQIPPQCWASPLSDSRWHRLDNVKNEQGLPTQGRCGLKKRVQTNFRLATINIGTLSTRTRELAQILSDRNIHIACNQMERS